MPDLGTKYECAECGAKFYDLGKPEPICPKCGTDQRQHQDKKPAAEPKARYVAPPKAAAVEEDDGEEVAADIVVEEDEEILVEPAEAEEEEEDDED